MIYDLIIIGAGAAGLFAAANIPTSDESPTKTFDEPAGFKIAVLEKTDKPGQKLLLTGNGQCNLTNTTPIADFLNHYGKNGKYLRPILFPFSNLALTDFFKNNNTELTIRDDDKVFPASMKSSDILTLLIKMSVNRGVSFHYETQVVNIMQTELNKPGYTLNTTKGQFKTKNVLIATGGASFPKTGSDGGFFSCLHDLGLKLTPQRPALTSVFVKNYPYRELSGLTLPDCDVTVVSKNEPKISENIRAGLLFTHKCFSGPAALTLSRYILPGDAFVINYLPGTTAGELRQKLIKTATGYSGRISTLIGTITNLPRSLIEQICIKAGVAKNEKASRLSGKMMGTISDCLTNDIYEITSPGSYEAAMVTAGGVCLSEINLKTMESKKFPGLYFAGEVLDVDGDTGGYNLQFAFSSAIRAIQAVC